MAYCPKCGVEVQSKKCPICSYVIKNKIIKGLNSVDENEQKIKPKLTSKEKYRLYLISTYFLSILVIGINITIDFIFNNSVTWSVYPSIPMLTLSFITTVAIKVKGLLKVVLILLFTLLMLLLLDFYIPEYNFFLRVSLPIVCILTILSFCVVLLSIKSKKRGANIAAYIILGLVLLSISIEIVIQMFNNGSASLSWSIITTVSLTPIAIFLLYIHFVLSHKIDFKKVFHT